MANSSVYGALLNVKPTDIIDENSFPQLHLMHTCRDESVSRLPHIKTLSNSFVLLWTLSYAGHSFWCNFSVSVCLKGLVSRITPPSPSLLGSSAESLNIACQTCSSWVLFRLSCRGRLQFGPLTSLQTLQTLWTRQLEDINCRVVCCVVRCLDVFARGMYLYNTCAFVFRFFLWPRQMCLPHVVVCFDCLHKSKEKLDAPGKSEFCPPTRLNF